MAQSRTNLRAGKSYMGCHSILPGLTYGLLLDSLCIDVIACSRWIAWVWTEIEDMDLAWIGLDSALWITDCER